MTLNVPELSLVLLIGPSGSGKSTFGRQHFAPFEVISSDFCRGLVSNNETDQSATAEAFDVLNFIVSKRLEKGFLTVVDATNVQASSRKKLIQIARQYHVLPVAIVLDIPLEVCQARTELRTDRNLGHHVLRQQTQQLRRSIRGLKKEGFRKIHHLRGEAAVNLVSGINRDRLYSDKKELRGPFDIIGDIHGCYDETLLLLGKLGYEISKVDDNGENFGLNVIHPEGRQVIFLGDLVDRGPKSPAVLKLAMSMVHSGSALCVPGNHDMKLHRKLKGKNVNLKHGLAETIEQLSKEPPEFLEKVKQFLYKLVSHYVLDGGKLVVAHAGVREEMQGRGSGAVRAFCLYGETTGEIDEFGLPVRHNWAAEYRGQAKVVYGHTPVPRAEWLNRTIDIDTGCVFGGELTALRYPEEALVSVKAAKVYSEPSRPLIPEPQNALSSQQIQDDLLDIEDVIGKRIIQTRLRHNLTIKEENSIAALEVMSRFAVNPKWLIYLPPTMSPCATSELPDYLEHPKEAIGYYRKRGIQQLVCEEKHMGSRAILVIGKDQAAIRDRFGLEEGGIGICYTRTGRNFFNNGELEDAFLKRVQRALTESDFWKKFQTDWVCLDAELMPWSAKAQALLQEQYAAVGAAAKHGLVDVTASLRAAQDRGIDGIATLLNKYSNKQVATDKFIKAYQQYCWPVNSLDDYKLAPFHIMATEGAVHVNKDHQWHMETIKAICLADPKLLHATSFKIINTREEESIQSAIDWWTNLTKKGGEGMVIKPFNFIATGKEGLLQPAVKCRGREYLRIIYGPEYDTPQSLVRLKKRGLGKKRSLALREFALGVEGLERFVNRQPLRRIHESVFGVLALESEEVDPRL